METDTSIHVLHIASGDLWAGAEMQMFTLAASQHAMSDVSVSAVLLNDGELASRLRETGIDVTILDESDISGLGILAGLISTMRKIRPDVVHTHRIKENILGSIATLFVNRIPSLRTAHGAQEHHAAWYQLPQRGIVLLDHLCGRWLQGMIVAVSGRLGVQLAQEYPADHIRVIENGIDCDTVKCDDNKVSFPQQYNVGIVGRLAPVKRIDLFLETAAKVCNSMQSGIHFHIIGDGPLSEELETQRDALGLTSQVSFHGHRENIYDYVGKLDVLMMTSDHEGLPMIILEAMALKIPVVSHAVGGIPTVLDEGNCGVLVDTHDADAYAAALLALLERPERMREISSAAYSRVTTRYAAKTNADSYLRLYREII